MDAATDGILYEQAISQALGQTRVVSLAHRSNPSELKYANTAARVDDAVLFTKTQRKRIATAGYIETISISQPIQSQSGI